MALRWTGIAHGLNFISLGIAQITRIFGTKNNLYIFHIAFPLLYAAYATAYYYSFDNKQARRAVLASIGFVLLASAAISATIQPLKEYNSYALTLSNVLLLIWSLYYIRTLFSEVRIANLEQDGMFWVSIGLLFATLGNFLATGLMNYLIAHSPKQAYKAHLLVEGTWFLLVCALLLAVFADKLFRKSPPAS